MELRKANIETDLEILAEMNQSLIVDEGCTNPMNIDQLSERMESWLKAEYEAEIITDESIIVGYCLWREYSDYTYIRQMFIKPDFRRKGYARNAIEWLRNNLWNPDLPLRMEVLIRNESGIDFWRKVGFKDYCITMEYKDA
ncbi:MAG: GNAT family N-acetyltransferase [Gammaproteobacteria bacterium]|nr:GNAT family N-acetyltransferase [Gammaproteobacteria bacterium]